MWYIVVVVTTDARVVLEAMYEHIQSAISEVCLLFALITENNIYWNGITIKLVS